MTHFFDQIIYSSANEDSLSEIKGLQLNEENKVLCLTGSGARVLDLLSDANCQITAVDFNPKQNYLLELKIAALKNLDYDDMLHFLGVNPYPQRIKLFNLIKGDLSLDALVFWQKQPKLIEAGVLYQGVWEKYMRYIARLLVVKRKTMMQLFSCNSQDAQRQIWNDQWKSHFWSSITYLLGRRFVWKYIMKEPGIYYVPAEFNITNYLRHRFDHIATTQLFRDNPYLNIIYHGSYPHDALPIHLQKKHFYNIKARLDNIEIKTQSLLQVLKESANTFNAFSLSDFSSYSNKEEYQHTWNYIIKAAKGNAKFVESSFLVKYPLEPELATKVSIDTGNFQYSCRLK